MPKKETAPKHMEIKMKNRSGYLIRTGFLLLLVASVPFFPGCGDAVITTTSEFDPNMNELSLLELWDMIANSTDIQEQTAEMGTFHMDCNDNCSMDHLYFTFGGRNSEGRPCIYFADFNHESKIDIRSYEVDSFPVKRHPALVFEEIDKLGLDSLNPSDEGMTIHISFMSGDVGYGNDYLNIFHLENGALMPLDEIIYHSQVPWCTISVYHLVPNDRTETWFLSEDISLAETVIYSVESPVNK